MSKRVQMPYEFLLTVNTLIKRLKLLEHSDMLELDPSTKDLCRQVEDFIDNKIESMERRELYTKSKIAETKTARELARQQYLDKAGIKQSFRY